MPTPSYPHLTLEHIDPSKHELVCGLDCDENQILADYSYNSRKQNRFVPYRVHTCEAPVNFGDVGEFLIEGEWLTCEFGGEEWWAQANRNGCGATRGGEAAGALNKGKDWGTPEGRRKAIQTQKENSLGIYGRTPEQMSTDGRKAGQLGGSAGKGLVFWVNERGKLTRARESPGEGWQRGRIWKTLQLTQP